MSLTIEDGTGVAGADSFATLADYEAFLLAYFGAAMTGTAPLQEAALRRAFAFMATLDWKPELWPTFGGEIPDAVKRAQSALARFEQATPGGLTPDVNRSQGKVLTQVGSIGWTPKDSPNTVEAARPVVTMAMDFLKAAGLLRKPMGGSSFVDRA